MADFLFPNFLNDPQEYARAEALWQERWQCLINQLCQQTLWTTPWLNTTFADGTAFQDGNPIFSAVCPSRRLGLRIIQLESADDPSDLAFWTDTFAEGEAEEIKELVVSCVLTEEMLADVETLMHKWVTGQKVQLPLSQSSGTDSRQEKGSGVERPI